jgi:hypothetical protein
MHRFPVTVLLVSGAIVGAGCSRTDTRQTTQGEASREATARTDNMASVRYISAMDAHSGTELYFGDMRLFASEGADKPTGYKPVPAERRDFVLREAGKPDGVEIEKNSEGLGNGKRYTAVAWENENGNPVLRVFNDDESAPAAGKAKVRLIHASAKAEPVAFYVAGQKDAWADQSRFTTASMWQEVDPVSGKLEVRVGDEKSGRRAPVPVTGIEAGKLYTFVVSGGPKPRVVPIVDSPAATE